MRKLLLAGACISALTLACSEQASEAPDTQPPAVTDTMLNADNPFAKPSSLDYQTPDFSKISVADYEPAFAAGMAEQAKEIEAIANNPDTILQGTTASSCFDIM